MKEINKKKKILAVAFVIFFLALVFVLVWMLVINNTTVRGKAGHYTYRYADDAPGSLNPLTWSSDSEREVLSYTTSMLYTVISCEDDTVEFLPELAAALPEDVTDIYAGDEIYDVPDDASEGYAYRITIREDAMWEDGTAITTADFAYSLQLYLDECSTHQSDYYNSYASLANAADYVADSYVSVYDSDNGYADVDDSELYFSLTQVNALFGTCSLEDYYTWYFQDKATLFIDDRGYNIYESLLEMTGGEDYIALTDESKALLQSFCVNYGLKDEEGYKRLCYYFDETSSLAWEQVGFIVEDDYTMTFVLAKEVDVSEFVYALSDLLLVKQDLYDSDAEGYGSSVDTYQSYGPYIITSYDDDGIVLEQNENWFGYSDESYEGQYQTTDIEIAFNLTCDEAMEKFTEGNLDDLIIDEDVIDTYQDSEYLYSFSDAATDMLILNTDLPELMEKSGNGESHTILSYKDFRRAIALIIDRSDYVDTLQLNGEAMYGLIGESYIAEISTMTAYRDTSYASEILDGIYGEADEDGLYQTYDTEKASQLLKSAYDACMMDGNIQGTDTIVIDFYSENAGADEYLQEAFDMATAGTSLEGKIIIQTVDNETEADIWECEVSGSNWDLCEYMQYYLDPDYAAEDGFPLGITKCTITLGDEKISMTYFEWYQELTLGKYRSAAFDDEMKILAYLEKGLLTNYQNIPLYSVTKTHLRSQRIMFDEEQYVNAELKYGGIRYVTYTMDDKEWAKYCNNQKNQLNYQ